VIGTLLQQITELFRTLQGEQTFFTPYFILAGLLRAEYPA
jgi:hypothetical protein